MLQVNTRRLGGIFVAVALSVFVAACSDSPTAPIQMFDNPSQVRVTNNLLGPVIFFQVRPCGTTQWGEDLLDPIDPIAGTIQPSQSKEFTVEAGCYDLRARHLETTEPGPLVEKTLLDQLASPVATLTWVLDPIGGGPN